jgi:TPR repeat protein
MKSTLEQASSPQVRTATALALTLLMTTAPIHAADDVAAHAGLPAAAYGKQDFAQTLAAREQRAIKGDIGAARQAGDMLLHAERLTGGTVQRDLPRAVAWLKRAANAGDHAATATLQQIAPTETPRDPVYIPGPSGC